MVIEYILLVIQIIMLIALLVLIFVIAQVLAISITMRDTILLQGKQPNGKPSNVELIQKMAEQVAAIDREMLPKDGATISFRINELTKSSHDAVTNAIRATADARSAIEEARNAARTASDERSRLERLVTALQTTTEGLLVATARATEAAVKIIQNTVTGTQNAVEVANSKIDQIAAGVNTEQTKTVVPEILLPAGSISKLEKGTDKVSEGVDTIQKGIDQLKDKK